ncbi:MAG: hypothetical protein N3G21_08795 [Candidatus Hydrogenedentes bacterium]|nr:hypothetical protein [Candidatus Hydrogenedentota bacterium]
MVILGLVLVVIGFGIGVLDFLGILSQLLPASLTVQISAYQWAFWGLGIVGVLLIILNRRPRD